MSRFVPRSISADMAAQGYNNEGRGELLGYVAVPSEHETTCRYRISTKGDPNRTPHETCTCRIGLWRDASKAVKAKASKPKKGATTPAKKVSRKKPR